VPRRLWNVYWKFFPRGLSGWNVKLTTHFHLATKLIMHIVPPLIALQGTQYRDSFLFVLSYPMQQRS